MLNTFTRDTFYFAVGLLSGLNVGGVVRNYLLF